MISNYDWSKSNIKPKISKYDWTPKKLPKIETKTRVGKVLSTIGRFGAEIAKDPLKSLLVQPAARTTEAVTRTLAPNSLAAKGYQAMSDQNQAQNFHIPVLGNIAVKPQKAFGSGGGEQIAGNIVHKAANIALFDYGKVAGVVGKTLGTSKLGTRLATDALTGVGFGAGTALENNKSYKDVAKEALIGGAMAGGLSFGLGKAGDLFKGKSKVDVPSSEIIKPVTPLEPTYSDVLDKMSPELAKTPEMAKTPEVKKINPDSVFGSKSDVKVKPKEVSNDSVDLLSNSDTFKNQKTGKVDSIKLKDVKNATENWLKTVPADQAFEVAMNRLELPAGTSRLVTPESVHAFLSNVYKNNESKLLELTQSDVSKVSAQNIGIGRIKEPDNPFYALKDIQNSLNNKKSMFKSLNEKSIKRKLFSDLKATIEKTKLTVNEISLLARELIC